MQGSDKYPLCLVFHICLLNLALLSFSYPHQPTEVQTGGVVYWNHCVHVSVWPDFVWMIPSEPLNFCNQTWYSGASSWVGVFSRKIDAHTSGLMSQWWFISSKFNCSYCSCELLIFYFFLQPTLAWWYIIISQNVLWENFWLLCWKSKSQQWIKISMNVSWWVYSEPHNLLEPNLVWMDMHHYEPKCLAKRLLC